MSQYVPLREKTRKIGCFGVLLTRSTATCGRFTTRFGFELLPLDLKQSMLVHIVDLMRNGF
jgi:hypothetical protein